VEKKNERTSLVGVKERGGRKLHKDGGEKEGRGKHSGVVEVSAEELVGGKKEGEKRIKHNNG